MEIPSRTKYGFRFQVYYTKGKIKPFKREKPRFRLAKGNKEISSENRFGLQVQEGAEISSKQIKAA